MKNNIKFGTDGIRGIFGNELTIDLVKKIGQILSIMLFDKNKKTFFLIGQDTRFSSIQLEQAITSGLCLGGDDVYSLGVISTPITAYLTKKLKAKLGIVISASHNQYEYNGIKIFDKNGLKINNKIEKKIEFFLNNKNEFETLMKNFLLMKIKSGNKKNIYEKNIIYLDYLKEIFKGKTLKKFKIVLDLANGALYKTAEEIFNFFESKAYIINKKPNGYNINKSCGSLYINNVSKKVFKYKADLGIAYDGDGDRVLMTDDLGRILDGGEILALLAYFLKKNKKLINSSVVLSVDVNKGIINFLRDNKIKCFFSDIGDKNISNVMLKNNIEIGGEKSGHIIYSKHSTVGDGLLISLFILFFLQLENNKLSFYKNKIKLYNQVSLNMEFTKEKFFYYKKIFKEKIFEINKKYNDDKHSVLVRLSGTEPVIRILIQGKNKIDLNKCLKAIKNIILSAINNNSVLLDK